MSKKFSIFSHSPNKHSPNSAVLHRSDVECEEGELEGYKEELVVSGHEIYACVVDYRDPEIRKPDSRRTFFRR